MLELTRHTVGLVVLVDVEASIRAIGRAAGSVSIRGALEGDGWGFLTSVFLVGPAVMTRVQCFSLTNDLDLDRTA